jgi:4-hydroxybenzoyl-CoA thioesterase
LRAIFARQHRRKIYDKEPAEMTKEPFSIERRIAWGECDPARIYYTPYAIDYAVEALEAWYESVLGVPLAEFAARYGFDAPFVRGDCHYLRPLVAGQVARLRIWVTGVGGSSLTFEVSGAGTDGQPCFVARLVACFVGRQESLPVQIPQFFRECIENYRQQCGVNPSTQYNLNWAGWSAGRAEGAVGSKGSFVRPHRVTYGDCDASGFVSAAKVYVYAVELVGEWFEGVLGASWMELVCNRDQGAPFVSISCQYRRPMIPGQKLTLALEVVRMGRASLEFAVLGYAADGALCFDALLTACFVKRSGFAAISIPEEFRQKIQTFMATDVNADRG